MFKKILMISIVLGLSLNVLRAEECKFNRDDYTKIQLKLYDIFKNIEDNRGVQEVSDCGSVEVKYISSYLNSDGVCYTTIGVMYTVEEINIDTTYDLRSDGKIYGDWSDSPITFVGGTIKYKTVTADEYIPFIWDIYRMKFKFNGKGEFWMLSYTSYEQNILRPIPYDYRKAYCDTTEE